VVSALEQILLAIENIYKKCNSKKEWTKHEIDKNEKKEKKEKKSYKSEYHEKSNFVLFIIINLVEEKKEMLKCINYYIGDYKSIIDTYQNSLNIKP